MNRYINFNEKTSSILPIGNTNSGLLGGGYLNNTTYIIIAAIILFSILALFYYFYYVSSKSNVEYHANRERVPGGSDGGNEAKTAELLFFGANWCPHCKAAKPVWNDLKTEYQNRTINGYQIIFTEIDCSEETPEVDKMMNQYNVEGYPTIKLLKDGQVIEYDAKPTKETLTQFLNTVL